MKGAPLAEHDTVAVLRPGIVGAEVRVDSISEVLRDDMLLVQVAELHVVDDHDQIRGLTSLADHRISKHGAYQGAHGGGRGRGGREPMGRGAALHLMGAIPDHVFAITLGREEPPKRLMERELLHVTRHDELDPRHD